MSIYDDVSELQTRVAGIEAELESALNPQNISENADLDGLGVGCYIIPTEEISATIQHKPTTSAATAFIQVCEGGADGQRTMIYQVCSKAHPAYYQRAYYQSTWGEWTKVDISDSGWKALPLASGITPHNAESFPCRYRKIGNTVYVQGCVTGFQDVEKVVATLPDGFRPSASFYSLQATQGGNIDTFNIRTNGEIKRMSTTMPVSSLSSTNYHFICVEFLTD